MHPYSCVIANRSQGLDWNTLDVSPLCRCYLAELDKVPGKFRECWTTAEKLALRLKVSVRSIARAQSEAVAKGLVSVVRNYGLRARRALLLLWRSAPAPVPAVEVASAPDIAPSPLPPSPAPDPASTPPEGPREKAAPKARASSARQATSIERELIAKAEAKFGPCFTVPVLSAIDNHGLLWTAQAIDDTPAGKPWAWLLGKLKGWRKAGEVQRTGEIDYAALMAANRAGIEAHWGPLP